MRRLLLPAGIVLALVPPLVFSGCLSDDSSGTSGNDASISYDGGSLPPIGLDDGGAPDQTVPVVDAGDAAADTGVVDSGVVDTGSVDANDGGLPTLDAGTANVRFANMVNGLGAIDVCASAPGQPLQGPFLKAAGVPAGLAYEQITRYVSVPLVSYVNVRIVAANAADCSMGLVPDFKNLPITIAQQATVALLGSTSDATSNVPALYAFPDDPPTGFPSTGSRVRFINAAPASNPIDVEIGAGATYVIKQQQGIPFGAASSAATTATGGYATDANGYFVMPFASAQITAVDGTTALGSFGTGNAGYSAGTTAFLIGIAGESDDDLKTVMCDDTASPAGLVISCLVNKGGPVMSTLRFANFAVGAPAFDVCLRFPSGPTTTFGPILAGVGLDGGVGHDQITGAITGPLGPIPTDTELVYSIIPAGQPCSATPLFTVQQFVYGLYRGSPPLISTTLPFFKGFNGFGYGSPPIALSSTTFSPGQATLEFNAQSFRGELVSGNTPLYDVFDTAPDGGTQVFAAGVVDNYELAGFLAPGTYGMQVKGIDGGATLYSQSGMTFGADEAWGLWLYDTSDTTVSVVRCNLGQLDAGALTNCAE